MPGAGLTTPPLDGPKVSPNRWRPAHSVPDHDVTAQRDETVEMT